MSFIHKLNHLIESLYNKAKNIAKKILLLDPPEGTPQEYTRLEISDIQPDPKKCISELYNSGLKGRWGLTYTDKLNRLLKDPNVITSLDYSALDKTIVGTILEKNDASPELMKLFNTCSSFSCATEIDGTDSFVSQLDKNFSCLIFPNSNYEKTEKEIKKREAFLEQNISVSEDGNSYTIIGSYSKPDIQCTYFLSQNISILEKGVVRFSLETACIPSQKNNPSSIKCVKSLERKNNTDMLLEEHVSDKSDPSSNYHYTISRHSDSDNIAVVSVSQDDSTVNSYTVANAPNSFLSSPLGWFKNNFDAQALLRGEKSPEELPSSRDNSTNDNLDTPCV